MTSTLTLASRLAALDDVELAALIAPRLPLKPRIDDFFDLAEALLEPPAVQHALTALDRPTLAVLAALSTGRPVDEDDDETAARLQLLADRALIERTEAGWVAYDPVRERLAAWPHEGLPSTDALITETPPAALAAVSDSERARVDQLAAERAFEAVSAFAELFGELDREPARELQKGGLSLPDGRRLAAAMAAPGDVVPTAMWLAERAGLVARDGSLWLTTDAAEEWLSGSTAARWRGLAETWLNALPPSIRELLRTRTHSPWGPALHETLAWFYPASGEPLLKQVERFEASGEMLGITAGYLPGSAGTALLEEGPAAASDRMAALLPAEVDKVYLQHDLTVVSPGPLAPSVDAHLRRVAEVESRALASTYRVTAASLERAIAAGESAQSIRRFLTAVSLTGIPQPLDYLIDEAVKRYGLVRVRKNGSDERMRSRVHSVDPDLIGALAVDQSFGALGFVRTGPNELVSRFDRDVVYWALADARYPVAAEDEHGQIVGVKKRHAPATDAVPTVDRAAQLVAHLREAASDASQSPEAWLSRQLETAVKARVPLVVTVGMPDGSELDFLLEPTGVGGGRLRGRDRKADIERTLPLKSIKGVRSP
ncbi:helicase-associated domain-containing protein [Gryllotalpicola ginsengisoli]|uniref:helicase-associated domain-containing protein n=1 Tax=Gryllotalpicola ginsengisoli TaxID=444608 RepID=UPI0003B6697A|nr:helicase-associated domain-containing protein [Gryllotalpicola ginsengisoli]